MTDFFNIRSLYAKKVGLPPGTLFKKEEAEQLPKPTIEVIDYDLEGYERKTLNSIDEAFNYLDDRSITWVNINGLHDIDLIAKVGDKLGLHPLVQEDISNTDHRPKAEEVDGHLLFILRMFRYNKQKRKIESEQVSIILGKNYVVSFQEKAGDVFDPIRKRIEVPRGQVRAKGADYLAYILLDILVDNYFSLIEYMGDDIEKLEDEIFRQPEERHLKRIQQLKKELVHLRKSIYPLRELVMMLERDESPLISKSTNKYLRDLYDHTISVIESLETYRDINSGLKDVYLSAVSHQMNKVMQVLTIMATIFIPITFVAGIYGMNFEYMPELNWKYSYFVAWGVMLAMVVAMVIYFKRKRWF